MDAFEKRIHELKDALDQVETPDIQGIWEGIATSQEKKKNWGRSSIWLITLGALLLSVGILLGYWWNESKQQLMEDVQIAKLPEPWHHKVLEYQKRASEQEYFMRTLLTGNTQLPLEALELEELDRMQKDFMADFQALPKNEKTAARYLHYYEQKIRILEMIIKQIQLRKNVTEKRQLLEI